MCGGVLCRSGSLRTAVCIAATATRFSTDATAGTRRCGFRPRISCGERRLCCCLCQSRTACSDSPCLLCVLRLEPLWAAASTWSAGRSASFFACLLACLRIVWNMAALAVWLLLLLPSVAHPVCRLTPRKRSCVMLQVRFALNGTWFDWVALPGKEGAYRFGVCLNQVRIRSACESVCLHLGFCLLPAAFASSQLSAQLLRLSCANGCRSGRRWSCSRISAATSERHCLSLLVWCCFLSACVFLCRMGFLLRKCCAGHLGAFGSGRCWEFGLCCCRVSLEVRLLVMTCWQHNNWIRKCAKFELATPCP